jgi:hypothetical protein
LRLDFSAAMDPASAGNAGNGQVDRTSPSRGKRKEANLLHPVPCNVRYDTTTHSVSLLLAGKQSFTPGSRITVIPAPSDKCSGASGVLLNGSDQGQAGDNDVFTFLPKATGITRG